MPTLIPVDGIGRAGLAAAMPPVAREFDLPPRCGRPLFSSFLWTCAVMQIPGGALADRYRSRAVTRVADRRLRSLA